MMNMGGLGTAMMQRVMKTKNVPSLPAMMAQAQEFGVECIACTMSMDIMGITGDERIDGLEFAGVASYTGSADAANVNLLIQGVPSNRPARSQST
jgi:peroxiredoxin family protein